MERETFTDEDRKDAVKCVQEEVAARGCSVEAACAKCGVKPANFYYWKKRLAAPAGPVVAAESKPLEKKPARKAKQAKEPKPAAKGSGIAAQIGDLIEARAREIVAERDAALKEALQTAFDRIQYHLTTRGVVRVPPELRPDLEKIARAARIANAVGGHEFRKQGLAVELSPYLKALLELEGLAE